jgi:hypothetical protein
MSFPAAPFQNLPQPTQFLGIYSAFFQDIEDQLFVRILKEPAHQMTDLGARSVLALNRWSVDVGATILYMLDISLLLQDSDGSENGVVGQSRLGGKAFENLLDRSRSPVPKDLHDAKFRFGERCRLLSWHYGLLSFVRRG